MTRCSKSLSTGIILLPAEQPRRFGFPKQITLPRNSSLLRHAAQAALEADLGPVNVVLGAMEQPSLDALAGLEVNLLHHPGWHAGMGSSIAAGIRPWLGRRFRPDGVILLPADQPCVTAEHLRALTEAAASGPHSIVASAYSGQLGAPAWFAADRFFRLLLLEGKQGVKSLIAREERLHRIDFPTPTLETGTPGDLTPAFFGSERPKPRAA